MSIKIICFEPSNGDDITKYDSGFGDRMRFWILAHYISTIINNVEIIVEEKYWPELLLLNLPNTKTENITRESYGNKLIPLSYQEVKNIVSTKNGELLNSSSDIYYYFNFLMSDICKHIFDGTNVPYDWVIHNAVSKIKLNSSEASDYMQQQFSDYCCIHLRRGNGTFPTIKFLKEFKQFLPIEIISTYWEQFHKENLGRSIKSKDYKFFDCMVQRDNDIKDRDSPEFKPFISYFKWVNEYRIVTDSDYFNLIINFLLKEDPNQKICISSDIPKKYYSYYYQNFPHNIIDTTIQFRTFLKFYEGKLDPKKVTKKYSIPVDKVFENVFDLVVGFHSKIIVKSTSNWSEICSLYKKKKVIYASMIESTNSLSNWIFMDEYPYLPLSSPKLSLQKYMMYRPTVFEEIDFRDQIIYNNGSYLT